MHIFAKIWWNLYIFIFAHIHSSYFPLPLHFFLIYPGITNLRPKNQPQQGLNIVYISSLEYAWNNRQK